MKASNATESAGRSSRTRSPRSRLVRLELLLRSAALSPAVARPRRDLIRGLAAYMLADQRLAGASFTVRTIPAGGAA